MMSPKLNDTDIKIYFVRLSPVNLSASLFVCVVDTFIASLILLWSLPLAI